MRRTESAEFVGVEKMEVASDEHLPSSFDEYGFAIASEEDTCTLDKYDEESNRIHVYSPQPSESVTRAWERVCEDWTSQSAPSPQKLSKLLRKGVPREMRGKLWALFLNSHSFKAQSSFDYKDCVDRLQSRLAEHGLTDLSTEQNIRRINSLIDEFSTGNPEVPAGCEAEGTGEGSFLPWARAVRQIMVDIVRTFPTHQLFEGDTPAKRSLLHLLVGYTEYNPTVGYCQGMAYVAALLLMNMDKERPKYLLGFYDSKLSRIRTHAEVFTHLLNDRLPHLGTHLEALGIHPLMIVPAWFMCLFTTLPCWDTVLAICDLIFLEGVNTIFKVSLAIMEVCSPELLAMHRLEDVLPFLQHLPSRLVSHKQFCRVLWQTVVEGWEVELFQDLVLKGMESERKQVKRVSPGEWEGGAREDGTKEPATKRKKVTTSAYKPPSSTNIIAKLANAIIRIHTPSKPRVPDYLRTPIPKNIRKGPTLQGLEGELTYGNIQCGFEAGEIELMEFSAGSNKLLTERLKQGGGLPMVSPFHHRKSPRLALTEETDHPAVSHGNQAGISPVIGQLRRSVRIAKRRSGVTSDGLPTASIISPASVRPLQDEIHSSRVYSEQKAFRSFATPTPRRKRKPLEPSSAGASPTAFSLLTPEVELKNIRSKTGKMVVSKMSPLVLSPAAPKPGSAKSSRTRKRLRED